MTKTLCPPYAGAKLSDVSQGFWARQIQGGYHTGVDFAPKNAYGKFLVVPECCEVKQIITDGTLDNDYYPVFLRGYGVVLQSLNFKNIQYLFWHCMQCFPVRVGQIVMQGQAVAQIGNSGCCYSGGKFVELKDRASGKGAHLHYERRDIERSKFYTDVLPYIDWTMPVRLNTLQAVQQTLLAMQNLIIGRE